jgi:hypothetical protein
MFTKYSVLRLFVALFIILMISGAASASPLSAPNGTSFTYQGKLMDGGVPANGSYDLQFKLFDALISGNQVGGTLTQTGVTVTNGLFTVQLDFRNVFTGTALYLEIGVRPGGSSGPYTTLTPRQSLSPTPYALYTTQAGSVPWSGLSGVPSAWSLTGNAGTNPASNSLGTTDNQPLELHVNGQRALRLEPSTGTPNLIGGYSGNTVTAGVQGATISGGGYFNGTSYPNHVTDNFGTIGGGLDNTAGDNAGTVSDTPDTTVAGGVSNKASGDTATVGGGWSNTASGSYSTASGGSHNIASHNYSTVSGGNGNTASGNNATVSGGNGNWAIGNYSFAAGNGAIASQVGSFVWSDSNAHTFDPFSYSAAGGYANSFNVRATNGVYLVTAIDVNGAPTAGAYIGGGGSGWSFYSDPSFKENFKLVDSLAILTRLASVPITSWNYKSQNASIQHIGPMAPAFNSAFGVGEPDKTGALKYINSLDADGVALASIQALYQLSQKQAAQIQALQDQLAKVEKPAPSNPVEAPSLIWIAISGFLALLVLLQAIMFFSLRRKSA